MSTKFQSTGKDYLSSKANSEELATTIRAYWAKLNKAPEVEVIRESFEGSDGRPLYRYVVRSNLVLDYSHWVKA